MTKERYKELWANATECLAEIARLEAIIAKQAYFKTYVHKRLDDAGIPKCEGIDCRISGRLDLVLYKLKEWELIEKALDAMPRDSHWYMTLYQTEDRKFATRFEGGHWFEGSKLVSIVAAARDVGLLPRKNDDRSQGK